MRNRNVIPELLNSVGIEIEFNRPTQKNLSDFLRRSGLPASVMYDVSAEEYITLEPTYKIPIRGNVTGFATVREKFGGELVSHILNMRRSEEITSLFFEIFSYLEKHGETPTSKTAGIHFHIDYPRELEALKKFVLISASLEKFWFSFGGWGSPHRAYSSDAVYYRPITGEGPLAVPVSKSEFAQCFSVDSLLKSKSLEEFFQRYGDSNGAAGSVKTPPVRYHYINLLNMLTSQKTAELRIFNTTLNPLNLWACLVLFRAMAIYAYQASAGQLLKDGFIHVNSVFDELTEPIPLTMERMIKAFCITDRVVVKQLEILAEHAKETTIPRRIIRSHLHDRGRRVPIHWVGLSTIPQPILKKSSIKHPFYEDAYVLKGEVNPQKRFKTLNQMIQESATSTGRSSTQFEEYPYKRKDNSIENTLSSSQPIYGEDDEDY